MTIFHSIILGFVEGFTEFLPISSTAHLTLTSHLLGLDQSAFVKSFEIVIQGGAILAVMAFYWKKFLDWEILKKLVVAFIPTGIIGLLLYKTIKSYLVGNISITLWSLAIGGIILIVFEKYFRPGLNASTSGTELNTKSISYARVMWIGAIQAIAVIPGVSRSAATIVGGRLLGMSREAVVEFSFLLAVPTILAATGLDLVKNISSFSTSQAGMLVAGFISSFVMAMIGIKFLLAVIQRKSFTGFGIYRIILAVLFFLFLMM
jgi:undecaprenyl-diphosphatase